MKKIILHIGPHKTASTYLQKELSDNYEVLRKHGVLYPKEWRDFLWGHHEFVYDFMKNHKSEKYKQDLVENLLEKFKEYDCIVLSSEIFEYFNESHISTLEILTEIAEVEIVYYMRKISGLSFSRWQERIKHGSEETFEMFLYTEYARPFSSSIFNYSILIDKFIDNLKDAKFSIIVYDNLMYKEIDLVDDFCRRILNIDLPLRNPSVRKINQSLQPLDIEITRALNILSKLKPIKSEQNIRKRYLEVKKSTPELFTTLEESSKTNIDVVSVDDSSFVPQSIYQKLYKNHPDNFLNSNNNKTIFWSTGEKEHKVISPNIWLDSKNTKILQKIFDKCDFKTL